jgi:hypothetical protein
MNFDTASGAEAAMMRLNAANMSNGDIGLLVKAQQLEAQWKAVE